MILSGADLVLPDRLLSPGSVVIEGGRIADIVPGARSRPGRTRAVDLARAATSSPASSTCTCTASTALDTLRGGATSSPASPRRLPRYGVTAFCPTTIACAPEALRTLLRAVRRGAVAAAGAGGAGAAGAPREQLHQSGLQRRAARGLPQAAARRGRRGGRSPGPDILAEIARRPTRRRHRHVAPEIEGGARADSRSASHGHHVSLGHSGATYEEALAGIDAGARAGDPSVQPDAAARSPRSPGSRRRCSSSDEVTAELICDGVHVHPAMVRVALAAKQTSRIMAITDGTAGAGLPAGTRTTIGGRPITVGRRREARGRHPGGQRADDGPRLRPAGERHGPQPGRCRDGVLDDPRPGARAAGAGRHRPGSDRRSGRAGPGSEGRAYVRRRDPGVVRRRPVGPVRRIPGTSAPVNPSIRV